MTVKSRTPIAYRPEIDGLRAIAIIPVTVFHLWPDFLPGGYLGVDIFFVISGFLVTSILIRESHFGISFLADFWIRRIRRLFPAFAVATGATLIFGYYTLFENEWKAASIQAGSALFGLSNIYYWRNANDYWGEVSERLPLLHTWSLSVEEQFYVFFPLAFWIFSRRFHLPTTAKIFLAIALLSLMASTVARQLMPSAAFYLLPTRAWELLLGVLVAMWASTRGSTRPLPKRAVIAVSAFVIVIAAILLPHYSRGISLLQTLAVTTGSAILIFFTDSSTRFVGTILSAPALVFIGKISYSLYLWHWPVIVYGRMMGFTPNFAFVGIAVTLTLLSYTLIEVPTRHLPPSRFGKVACAILCILFLILFVPFGLDRTGVSVERPEFTNSINLSPKYKLGYFGNTKGDYTTGLILDNPPPGDRLDLVLLGDSHSLMFFPAIHQLRESLGISLAFYGADGGTSPFFVGDRDPSSYYVDGWTTHERRAFDRYRKKFLSENRPKIVIVAANWTSYVRTLGKEGLRTHLLELRSAAPDSMFLFLGQPPVLPFGGHGLQSGELAFPVWRGFSEDPSVKELRAQAHESITSFCNANNPCDFLDLEPNFMDGQSIRFRKGEILFYKDDDHLSVHGSLTCADEIESKVRSMLQRFEKSQ